MSKSNFSDFQTLSTYNKNVLGIPTVSSKPYQVIPTWKNTDYMAPNYNSLNPAQSYQNFAPINASYNNSDVNYFSRKCVKGGVPPSTPQPM